jgi:hypothetical protein
VGKKMPHGYEEHSSVEDPFGSLEDPHAFHKDPQKRWFTWYQRRANGFEDPYDVREDEQCSKIFYQESQIDAR